MSQEEVVPGSEAAPGARQPTGATSSVESEVGGFELPTVLPVLPLRTTVVFPHMVAPLSVLRPSSVKLVDDCIVKDKFLAIVAQKDRHVDEPSPEDMYSVGTASTILKMLKFPDGSTRIICQGLSRVRLVEILQTRPYVTARIEVLPEVAAAAEEATVLVRSILVTFDKIAGHMPQMPEELRAMVSDTEEPGRLADLIATNLNLPVAERQQVLEATNLGDRLKTLAGILNRELRYLELGSKIESEVQSQLSAQQREFFLRRQLDAIRKELGEADDRTVEVRELRERIDQAQLAPTAREVALKELDRLEKMHPSASEYTVSRTYLDWLISMPWTRTTEDNLDVGAARTVLDADHYDLADPKERILEYLSVRRLKQDMKGPILCFVGPPGVGKTSLGRSIARALGRKFVRVSLGGVRDEAEIRGHRRTYVGALPGRIIQSIRTAGSRNPVFMLDEVDKLGIGFQGDPAAALLEVLDPEQNSTFSDHYLEVPFDLSPVMFITTANVLDTIPPALLDRMEVLRLPGYTDEEKLHIARVFLVPKQLAEHGLDRKRCRFRVSALKAIIRLYTREAGVRNLEREVASICRKVAREVAEEPAAHGARQARAKRSSQVGLPRRGASRPREAAPPKFRAIGAHEVTELLGPPRFLHQLVERKVEPGVATGLAWTPSGGEILFIESTRMAGNKGLILTGSLGEVMKESAQAALSYVRSRADRLALDPGFFAGTDIHIHVPSGQTPKDGPSAGIAMAASLMSLLTGTALDPRVAMTGEITLRGKVLPVGGIKEKVLAAYRAGVHTVVLPQENEKDLREVHEEARKKLAFHFAEQIDDIWPVIFPGRKLARSRRRKPKASSARA
jgi:ATP-dependent Lon protease